MIIRYNFEFANIDGKVSITQASLKLFFFQFFFWGGAFTIGQAAQHAPQKTTDPALAGSVRTRCPRTHSSQLVRPPHSSALLFFSVFLILFSPPLYRIKN
jgi:hypothetical protein